ncbi:MAG: bifunctional phosphopantothenoylcysteine decarboxylase/phosphopantothenate--cysteine ligase CoaBC [Candidatus Hydrothermarchaeota archaeon]|jgi:phosphopantothenoylcysteine decarboxylase/phosphopantothenate--cysteine ligase|nr:bifunctional phosphopantothenoylcysteine decarboxylase/phosphopantothenate--cysteine ligase CoaBC [Candidatus Hydrothermarchaeota archaeon]
MLKRKSDKLKGRKIALCVTGSIAAIEAPKLARELARHGADVTAYMSPDACKILHQNALEFATGKEVVLELTGKLEHLMDYDLLLVVPATATTIGKLAHGIADTPVTALLLSSSAKVLLAPAMHASMHDNPFIAENVRKIRDAGYAFVEPRILEGAAKMAVIEDIVDEAVFRLHERDCSGLRVLITAGPTIEYIDPIRIITNKSSGKMGLAVAKEAFFRGANTTLIMGRSDLRCPPYLRTLMVETCDDMERVIMKEIKGADVFVSAAAVSDFKAKKAGKKISSKEELNLHLVPTPKILAKVKNFPCVKVGFKALHDVSVEKLKKASHRALEEHGLDLVVGNDVSKRVLGAEENEVVLVSRGGVKEIPRSPKSEVASRILDAILGIRRKKNED